MATPIFSNSVIGQVFQDFMKERTNPIYPIDELLLPLQKELEQAIRKYFEERKCLIDKEKSANICDMCLEDNQIEKDLIGVFVIAK